MNTRKSFLFILPLMMLVMLGCRATNVNVNLNRQTLQGSGTAVSEAREISGIKSVSLRDFGDLTITQGERESLTVEADDNIMPHLKTEMSGSELILRIEDGYNVNPKTPIRYTLQVKSLDRINVDGAGKVSMDSLKTQSCAIRISGAGDVNFGSLEAQDANLEVAGTGKMKMMNVKLQNLRVTASGAGDFEIAGETDQQSVTISGVGSYNAPDLKSADADMRISGAGNMTLWVDNKLTINIAGFGNVNYYGLPSISQSISGGGSVKGLGAHK